jgi:hypothetical protein
MAPTKKAGGPTPSPKCARAIPRGNRSGAPSALARSAKPSEDSAEATGSENDP